MSARGPQIERDTEGWSQTAPPLPIGPQMGSCGTAAFLKKPVISSDDCYFASFAVLCVFALSISETKILNAKTQRTAKLAISGPEAANAELRHLSDKKLSVAAVI